MALVQHHFICRLFSTVSHGAYAAPLSFINYLLNKMNNFTSSRPTLWLKSSRNCSGGWRGLVGEFSYYIKIFYQIYFIKIYIWKRGKPKSAKHRRILMPIWFHSLTILPGSAAGAAALVSNFQMISSSNPLLFVRASVIIHNHMLLYLTNCPICWCNIQTRKLAWRTVTWANRSLT